MEGRFIARISVPRTEKDEYKKYGLVPGETTYWWVQTDSTNKRSGQSVFITTGPDGRVNKVIRPLTRYLDEDSASKGADQPSAQTQEKSSKYKPAKLRRAIVRWIWSLEDETAKGKCGSGSCQ